MHWSTPYRRQRGRRATVKVRRQWAKTITETASSTKLWARSQLLTKSSWDPGKLTSAKRVTARDQLPRGDTWHIWDGTPTVHPGNWAAGMEAVIRHIAQLGEWNYQAPGCLSCSDLGRAQNAVPTESVPLWSTQEPEPERLRPGKCTQPRASFRQFPCRAIWSLSSVDRESTHAVSGGKPSVAWTLRAQPTESTAHARQWYLFAVFLPPHSTTE